ncbi:halocyanin domain protein [Halorubrum californiense DSM 19288]|uniref:Halocyanin domain protein n=1 Tax=Halorubrum californiense DSM 19288 TaxID=1227465 RepID=M0DWV1_9EURY|nr:MULTISPECIES: halocyanin domain-containing protein [Halorubrum]ELZ39990.1 halocyanin domain protein [Halorubrum californiense DSM 19288]TKX73285.1 halocyanin domain-containing protein [Halorubrum sp. GN11GM_10-3_MGM]
MTDRSRRDLLAAVGTATAAVAGCVDAALPGSGTDGRATPSDERVDRTGEPTVEVAVGANGGFSYAPAHIRVDDGTTVVWEWTGSGGGHDVYAVDGSFASDILAGAGSTFQRAFEVPGTHQYLCTPHQTRGMRGSVEVVSDGA